MTDLRALSPTGAGVVGLRIVAHFPIDFPEASVQATWPDGMLARLRARGWQAPDARADLALQQYGHTVLDELVRSMPTAVLDVEGDLRDPVFAGLSPDTAATLGEPVPGWSLIHLRVSLWNLGNGLATLTYEVPAQAAPTLAAVVPATRGHVYRLMPEVSALVGLLTAGAGSTPVVLWGNPMYLARVGPRVTPEARREIGAVLTTNGADCTLDEHPDAELRIGRHCSAVCVDWADPSVHLLLRLTGVHQVCWASALLYDARLSRELELVRPDDPALRLRALEGQAERILASYHLVRLFRLRYSSVEAHLDTGASVMWQALEENWKFPSVLASLDNRLDVVRTLHQQLYTRLQDSRSRLLNELVVVFTFLNLFNIALAALTFASLESLAYRTVTVVAMVVVLVLNAAAYLWFRRWTNRH